MEFPDLTGLNSEIMLVPITDLVPFHSRTDAGLRVKATKVQSRRARLHFYSLVAISGYAYRKPPSYKNPPLVFDTFELIAPQARFFLAKVVFS